MGWELGPTWLGLFPSGPCSRLFLPPSLGFSFLSESESLPLWLPHSSLSVSLQDKRCCVALGKPLSLSEPQSPHPTTGSGGGALLGARPPLSPGSLCRWRLSTGGQVCPPPHSTALTPPLPFPQPPPLPAVPAELWEFSGFGLPSPPLASPRPFITLSQIFVLADKSLVLELSLEGQAVRAGRPLDTIPPKTPSSRHRDSGPQRSGGSAKVIRQVEAEPEQGPGAPRGRPPWAHRGMGVTFVFSPVHPEAARLRPGLTRRTQVQARRHVWPSGP